VSLKDLLSVYPEESVSKKLSGFSCKRDADVESFLKTKAIAQEKRQISRTYLIFTADRKELVAYFTVAISSMEVSDLQCSKNMERMMNIQKGLAQCYLLGQLGKCDGTPMGLGKFAMGHAINRIMAANLNVGCRLLRVDCKDSLKKYYEENGFSSARRNKDNDYMQMIRIIGTLPAQPAH